MDQLSLPSRQRRSVSRRRKQSFAGACGAASIAAAAARPRLRDGGQATALSRPAEDWELQAAAADSPSPAYYLRWIATGAVSGVACAPARGDGRDRREASASSM